jgi:hypothetical protein
MNRVEERVNFSQEHESTPRNNIDMLSLISMIEAVARFCLSKNEPSVKVL